MACALFLLFLTLGACGSDEPVENSQADTSSSTAPAAEDATQEPGSDEAQPDTAVDSGDTAEPAGTSPTPIPTTPPLDENGQVQTTPDDDDADSAGGLDAETLGDRGLREPGEERSEDDADSTDGSTPAAEATSTPESETVSVEPTPTPGPTPTSPPLNDPVAPPSAQLPDEPVPSDDLVIQGPPTDDGTDIPVFSNEGILACATTEAAIEFLDRGDLTRTEQALQSAAALASSASEAQIASLAPQLSTAGRNSDAAFDAIVAMLSACAQYGYEV